MGIGKKGIFYFIVAIIFVGIIGILVTLTQAPTFSDRYDSVTSRVTSIDDFIKDFNNDAEKATYIAAYRSLIVIEEEIASRGEYYEDVTPVFEELFFNGTLNGVNKTLLNTSSFSDYVSRVSSEAEQIGINLEVTLKSVELYHKTPWKLSADVTFTNNLTDKRGVAVWYYEKTQSTDVPIFNLRDPLYSVGTLGRVPNVIRKTNLSYFINDSSDANDTTNLMEHVNESFYIENNLAPDYLMRIEGNFNSSEYGIESLVDIANLQNQDVDTETGKSVVDYIYFQQNLTNASPVCYDIINTPSWFRLDEDHLPTYEISTKLDPEGGGYECP